jgi:hypothetical protein
MLGNNSYDAFISYSNFDKMIVNQVNEALSAGGLKAFIAEHEGVAGVSISQNITNGLSASRGAIFFLSPNSVDSGWVKREIELALSLVANKQIKFLAAVLLRRVDVTKINKMLLTDIYLDYSNKELSNKEDLNKLCEELTDSIRKHVPEAGKTLVGVPLVILAMTRAEAKALLWGSVQPVKPERFNELRAELKKSYSLSRLIKFYGEKRDDWRSPLCQTERARPMTIKEFIGDVVIRLNDAARSENKKYLIDLQFRSEDFTNTNLAERVKVHTELEDRCMVVVDSLSLFHPTLAEIVNHSPLHSARNIFPIAVPPPYYHRAGIDKIIESAMKEMLALPYHRFETNLDRLCEFGISHPRALKRWLFAALPEAANKFNCLSPRDENREDFRAGRWS